MFEPAMFFKRRILPVNFPSADINTLRSELARRMEGVQRHRLLQGFPMAPMMAEAPRAPRIEQSKKPLRPLIVGVLPHPFCVPAVKGCGFCTFPHEALSARQMVPLAHQIVADIHAAIQQYRWSTVPAIYLGGGTANLTSTPALSLILGALAGFRCQGELTLEGVPRFFSAEQLDLLCGLGLERVRISMGVQTFDVDWLTKMGRQNIGSPEQVSSAIALAQQRSVGTSVDLLINLPGQPTSAMLADIQHAIALGVDQICMYHLVLRESLPVPWAKDPAMLAALPDNSTAFDSWRACRDALLEAGYIQRTLTNFERGDLPSTHRFRYEAHSFRPHTCDALGFGPQAISGLNFGTTTTPLKWLNPAGAEGFLERARSVDRIYVYEPFEDALMQLTRGLALLEVAIDEGALATHHSAFAPELERLEEAGLITRSDAVLRLTTSGMFYADSVAGLLAWRTVQYRNAAGLNEPDVYPMG